MSKRRVAVTGLGIVSPVGIGVAQAWDNVLKGVSGVGPITRFDASQLPTRIAAEVKGFNSADWMPPKETRRSDLFIHFGIAATKLALEDSGFVIDESNADRVGVVVGSGIGGLPMIEDNIRDMIAKGPRRLSPFFVPGSIINMVAGLISIQFKAKGPNVSMVSACTTSAHCVGEAARMIEYGDADVMIAGGAEACVNMSGVGGFCACKALSERNDDPATASRPFDVHRDGFVMGEGGGCLVLEEYEHARSRGAKIYAEVAGAAMTADAWHMTATHPEGLGAYHAMRLALKDAALNVSEVDYVNMHATSTPVGDLSEIAAITKLFGSDLDKVHLSATKSMTGHLLGAAGAIEAIASIASINEGVIAPTINTLQPDAQLPATIQLVLKEPLEKKVDVAMSNTFGFGGHNGIVVFKSL